MQQELVDAIKQMQANKNNQEARNLTNFELQNAQNSSKLLP